MSRSFCKCCGSNAVKIQEDRLQTCPACGAVSIFPVPLPDVAAQVRKRYKSLLPEFDDDFDWRVFLMRALLPNRGRVLEVGNEAGTFTRVMEEEGRCIHSVDTKAVTEVSSSYDAVVLWDVLENVPDPKVLLERCTAMLKDQGLLLIRIIDSGSFRNEQRRSVPQEWGHIHFLSQPVLEKMVRKVLGIHPLFIQIEKGQEDFLLCVARKGDCLQEPTHRVLMIAHPDAYAFLDDTPGPRMRIFKTMLHLRKRGIAADLSISPYPQCRPYDVVHLFHHAWKSGDNLQQAICAKYLGRPLVVSTIYMELSETNFALRAVPKIFEIPFEEEREAYLKSLADGELMIRGFSQKDKHPQHPGLEDDQRALFGIADHLIGLSLTEIRQIGLSLGIHKPFTIVPNCADPEIFEQTDPRFFSETFGLRDFVISVGHIEGRKNQLMLLYALRGTDVPVVMVGASHRGDFGYFDLCRHYASERTLFISQLSQQELASAFAASRVHALPSWTEGASLASIEAAMAGCGIVVGNRSGEWEYYQEDAFYCNPAGVSSIRKAVEGACWSGDVQERRKRLKDRALKVFTFENAAEKTLEAYERSTTGKTDHESKKDPHPHVVPG